MATIKAVFRFPFETTPEPIERIYENDTISGVRNRLREYDIISVDEIDETKPENR